MVGDDAAQRAFAHYWHTLASPTGSRLVYSTGRSLDSFLGLARDKGTLMVRPHVLICAVGTKVYLPAVDGRGWREDPAWTARLDQGWDLEKLRRITNGASCVKPPLSTSRLASTSGSSA
jgi:sucrose-6-phosphatase